MKYRNRMFRRLSIFFLLMALIALTSFVFILFFMAKDNVFICPENQLFCYISPEYSYYRSAIYGLAFSMILLVLLSSLFNKQIEFIAEYSGYTKSDSDIEREKVDESNQSSSALKEYFLHMQALEKEQLDKERQLTIDEIINDEETIEEVKDDIILK